jgi:hypothetical protein
MHPDFLQMRIDERQRELEEQVHSAFLRRQTQEAPAAPADTVVLRLCSVHDDPALERIAALEGVAVPSGRHVVAEVNGSIVAALPLAGGPALADPFHATAQLMPLLQLRARQLTPTTRTGRTAGIRSAVRWGRA